MGSRFIDFISKIIEDNSFSDFVVIGRNRRDTVGNPFYEICPVTRIDDDDFKEIKDPIISNYSIGRFYDISKEELILNFELIFGKQICYEVEITGNGNYSEDKTTYRGRIRR